jgi:hypothetical protein
MHSCRCKISTEPFYRYLSTKHPEDLTFKIKPLDLAVRIHKTFVQLSHDRRERAIESAIFSCRVNRSHLSHCHCSVCMTSYALQLTFDNNPNHSDSSTGLENDLSDPLGHDAFHKCSD